MEQTQDAKALYAALAEDQSLLPALTREELTQVYEYAIGLYQHGKPYDEQLLLLLAAQIRARAQADGLADGQNVGVQVQEQLQELQEELARQEEHARRMRKFHVPAWLLLAALILLIAWLTSFPGRELFNGHFSFLRRFFPL